MRLGLRAQRVTSDRGVAIAPDALLTLNVSQHKGDALMRPAADVFCSIV
jgi:hypothetical protein